MGKKWKRWQTSLGSKINVDGDCSHEIKKCFLLGRTAMTSLHRVLPRKVPIVKAMFFPVVMYRYEWDHKEGWALNNDTFELWCWRRLLRVPWIARRSNQSVLKEINPEYLLEGLMLKLSSNTLASWCKEPTYWKRLWCWERLRAREGGDRRWDGWMASLTQWTWVWANSGR